MTIAMQSLLSRCYIKRFSAPGERFHSKSSQPKEVEKDNHFFTNENDDCFFQPVTPFAPLWVYSQQHKRSF